MFNIIKNHNTVIIKAKTLSAARDALADIRKNALKQKLLATYDGKDCIKIGRLGSAKIETTYNIMEG
jgi:hypothetical protein